MQVLIADDDATVHHGLAAQLEHPEADFSHGVLPTCLETATKEFGV